MKLQRLRFSLRTTLILIALIAASLGALLRCPRSRNLQDNERFVGHYTGLGVRDDNSSLGFRYHRFTIDDSPTGHWEITNTGKKYNRVTRYYPDGTVAVTGDCVIAGTGRNMFPLLYKLDSATCYRPDGTEAATIANGAGTLICFYPSGQRHWEMVLHPRWPNRWPTVWDQEGNETTIWPQSLGFVFILERHRDVWDPNSRPR